MGSKVSEQSVRPVEESLGTPPKSARRQFYERFKRQRGAVVGACFLVFMISIALLAPVIAPHSPSAISAEFRLTGPSATYWLGTDDLGRDIVSRMLFASRDSLQAALIAVTVALAIGLPFGLASGFVGGLVDQLISRLNDGLMAFPSLVLAIAIVGVIGPGLRNAMIAIGISYAPNFVRIIRGATIAVRQEVFIEAAYQVGSPVHRTLIRHVFPNVLSPIIVQTTLASGLAILAESTLSFLGLGSQPPTPSWGGMLSRGFQYMHAQPFNVIAPGFTIVLVVYAINLLGDGIHDAVGREIRRAE